MAFLNPLSFSFKPKRLPANLYCMTLASVLCSLCYLVGIWQHSSRTFTGSSYSLTDGLSCSLATQTNRTTVPAMATAATTTVHLNFSSHRHAQDPPHAAASKHHFPRCSPELSEYTPCEDPRRSLKFDRERLVYRERHCPEAGEVLRCRIPAPKRYRVPFRWPESRESVWFANVPHKELTVEKKMQNWVRFNKGRFSFPGGGTMFPNGADKYIDDIGKLINLNDGSIRTAVDTGCGVASWGAYLLSRNILTVSFAPRDTHEAQVQFALERGVPALIGILASKRLPYPSRAFDMAHCSRCLIPWGQFDGLYLIEVDRILRPGGYWIISGPPINWETHWKGWERTPGDLKAEQSAIETVARSLCWKKLKQKNDIAIWQKPTNHLHCITNRKVFKKPQFCQAQDPDRAWYTKMEDCLTPLPQVAHRKEVAGGELAKWPERLNSIPPRIISGSLEGITAKIFTENTEIWKKRVAHYKEVNRQLGQPGRYRNLLDMNSFLGGFAAALVDDPVWVMNIVPVEAKVNTLGVIYERGLIGTYQNWCEAMSTYPRTYDFIHSDSVFTLYKDRCKMEDILLEMDRILRPEGSIIIRDDVDFVVEIRSMMDAMEYDTWIANHEKGPHDREKILLAVKRYWTSSSPNHIQRATKNVSHF
nr:probable methyltransferase PMT15 isoform X1 [Ziziphus jujuba var. spinosa]